MNLPPPPHMFGGTPRPFMAPPIHFGGPGGPPFGVGPPPPNLNPTPSVQLPTKPLRVHTPKYPPPTEPNQTLYIRNLHQSKSIKALTKSLTAVFSQYGEILNISAKKAIKYRGQAFITFKSVESAIKAKDEVQSFPLFDLPMDIQFARDPLYAVAEKAGILVEVKKRRAERKLEMEREPKKPKAAADRADEMLPPNSLLLVRNLPEGTTQELVVDLFKQFPGLKEVRVLPRGSDIIALVEYENEMFSSEARMRLNGYKITENNEIRVTFARK